MLWAPCGRQERAPILLPIRKPARDLRGPLGERRSPMASHYEANAEPTIWEMPDALWADCRALLPPEKPLGTRGRPVVPFRRALDRLPPALPARWPWKAG